MSGGCVYVCRRRPAVGGLGRATGRKAVLFEQSHDFCKVDRAVPSPVDKENGRFDGHFCLLFVFFLFFSSVLWGGFFFSETAAVRRFFLVCKNARKEKFLSFGEGASFEK